MDQVKTKDKGSVSNKFASKEIKRKLSLYFES